MALQTFDILTKNEFLERCVSLNIVKKKPSGSTRARPE